MGPMLRRKSARAFTRGAIPKEEPMRKQALPLPEFFTSRSFSAKASLDRSLPSGVKTHSQAPFGIRARMASASFSSPWAISEEEGFSGSLASGSSRRVNRQYPDSRLAYSAAALR